MRLYYDIKSASDCVGIFLKDTEIVAAGTTISAASSKNNNMELQRIADDYNIHCIFNDNIPTIDFYAVPQFDIFAHDGCKGYFGMLPQRGDAVYYISQDRECFWVTDNISAFIHDAANWRKNLMPCNSISIYPSKEEAEKVLGFIDLNNLLDG